MYIIIKGKKEEEELAKEKRNAKIEAMEAKKGRSRDKDVGYSKPGYNFGLGEYIHDQAHYKRILREKKAENPNFQEAG